MKHSQWLTLQKEGEQIVMALTALGYRCLQPTPSLFWTVRQEQIFYRGINPAVYKTGSVSSPG